MPNVILLPLGVFLAVLAAGLGLSRVTTKDESRRLRDRLRVLSRQKDVAAAEPSIDILRDQKLSGIPAFDAILRTIPVARSLQLLLLQGASRMRGATWARWTR